MSKKNEVIEVIATVLAIITIIGTFNGTPINVYIPPLFGWEGGILPTHIVPLLAGVYIGLEIPQKLGSRLAKGMQNAIWHPYMVSILAFSICYSVSLILQRNPGFDWGAGLTVQVLTITIIAICIIAGGLALVIFKWVAVIAHELCQPAGMHYRARN